MVTPEAVALELPPANVGSRLFGLALDWLVISVAGGLLSFGFFAAARGVHLATGWVIAAFVLLYGALIFGYPVACETLWRGRTVGKAAMGLRVVTVEGAPVRFRHAAIRAALGLVELGLTGGAVAVLSILVTRRHQRLGDLVAGTLVLRERSGLRAPTPVRFTVPYGMEAYAATLDVAGVTTDDYVATRTFLVRAAALPPGVRWWLSDQVATPVATRVRPSPPAGVSAEAWLACVAAVYQNGRGTGWSPPPPPPPSAPPASASAGDAPDAVLSWAAPPDPSPDPDSGPGSGPVDDASAEAAGTGGFEPPT
ncbi:MAG: RDD family protein [Acidimicrobiales bacterium]